MSQQILAKNLKKSSKFVDILAKHFNLPQNFDSKFEILGNFEISTSFLKLVGHTLHVSDFTSKRKTQKFVSLHLLSDWFPLRVFFANLRPPPWTSHTPPWSPSSSSWGRPGCWSLARWPSWLFKTSTDWQSQIQERERELTGNFNSAFFRISGSSDGSRTTCLNSSQSTRRAHSLRSAPKRECVNDESWVPRQVPSRISLQQHSLLMNNKTLT